VVDACRTLAQRYSSATSTSRVTSSASTGSTTDGSGSTSHTRHSYRSTDVCASGVGRVGVLGVRHAPDHGMQTSGRRPAGDSTDGRAKS
jgi:hypothetical protein